LNNKRGRRKISRIIKPALELFKRLLFIYLPGHVEVKSAGRSPHFLIRRKNRGERFIPLVTSLKLRFKRALESLSRRISLDKSPARGFRKTKLSVFLAEILHLLKRIESLISNNQFLASAELLFRLSARLNALTGKLYFLADILYDGSGRRKIPRNSLNPGKSRGSPRHTTFADRGVACAPRRICHTAARHLFAHNPFDLLHGGESTRIFFFQNVLTCTRILLALIEINRAAPLSHFFDHTQGKFFILRGDKSLRDEKFHSSLHGFHIASLPRFFKIAPDIKRIGQDAAVGSRENRILHFLLQK
jgi:hypothetical protein